MAKGKLVDCHMCGHSYYIWRHKKRECPFCEESRFKESNPAGYIKWKKVEEKNNELSNRISYYISLFDSVRHSLFIGLPILIFLYVGVIEELKYNTFNKNLGIISMALIIGVMLNWAIRIGLGIYGKDTTVFQIFNKRGECLREEIGDSHIINSVIIVGIILIFLINKYYIKSGTAGYITRRCIVGFTMFAIESLITGIKIILLIKTKVCELKCRRSIINLTEFRKNYKD